MLLVFLDLVQKMKSCDQGEAEEDRGGEQERGLGVAIGQVSSWSEVVRCVRSLK